MLKRLILFLPIANIAVRCGPVEKPNGVSEWRIDASGANDLIDSHSSNMCVTENGTVYVVWVDDRLGGESNGDIWFNRKLPGAESHEWLDAAVRVNQNPDSSVWHPKVACSNQQVHIVWEDDRDGEVESHQIYYQRSSDFGDSWLTDDVLIEEDEDGRSNSFSPQILVRENIVYVAWYDDLNGAFDILLAASYNSGSDWSSPHRIDTDTPAGRTWSAHPKIAASADGQNVYVTWQDFRNGVAQPQAGSDIYFNRSTNSGNDFGDTDVRLDSGDGAASSAFAPRVAADGTNVYVAWHDDRNGDNDVFMTYSGDGGVTWTLDSRADQADPAGLSESLYPKVCISDGVGHVVWHDDRTGNYRVYYNSASSGVWSGAESRLDAYKPDGARGVWRYLGGAEAVQLVCDSSNLLVTWLDTESDANEQNYNDIVYNFSADNGSTWTVGSGEDTTGHLDAPYRLDSNTAGSAYKQDLSTALHGDTVYASWTDGRNGSTDIFYQELTAGEVPIVLLTSSEDADRQ